MEKYKNNAETCKHVLNLQLSKIIEETITSCKRN